MLMCIESRLTEMGRKRWGKWKCGDKYQNRKWNDRRKTVRHDKQQKKVCCKPNFIFFKSVCSNLQKIEAKIFWNF